MSKTYGTPAKGQGRGKRRRPLPPTWHIVEGMKGAAAQEVDPVIEQTREMVHVLFGASFIGGIAFRSDPTAARAAWLEHALRRGDAALCAIIEKLDDDTFTATWLTLVRRLQVKGPEDMLEWLRRRRGGDG